MLEFAISEISLSTQKNVVKEEKLERYDNTPYGSLSIRMNRLAYQKFPYWWAVIGDMETIDAATLTDVRNFYETYYVPNNAVLVLAGDFEPVRTKELIERYFGGIPRGKSVIARPAFDEPVQTKERREIVSDEPVPLPGVFYAYHAPEEGTREFMALDLLTDILSSGQSSRLYQRLVYEAQLCSEASAHVDGREMPGLVYVYGVANDPGVSIAKIEQAIENVLTDVITHGVTATELEKAKNKTEARTVTSRLTLQGKADDLAHAALMFGDPDRANTILGEYLSITPEEIQFAAKRYLTTANRSAIIYEPAEIAVEEEI